MDSRAVAAQTVKVLFEDDQLLLVEKPAGLRLVEPGSAGSAGAEPIALVLGRAPLLMVRPLEQHVSGIVVLAKTEEAAARLRKSLATPRSRTDYLAVVRGQPRSPRPADRRGRQAGGFSPGVRLVRHRKDLSLVQFRHDSPRTAEVRADLRSIGLTPLGDVPVDHRTNRRRPAGRLFLHRSRISFPHPATRKTVRVETSEPRAFQTALAGGDLIEDLLQIALSSRIGCLVDEGCDSWRLFSGKAEGVPGLVVEKLGPAIVLQTHQGKFMGDTDRVRRIGKWYARVFGATAVYHKRFIKARGDADAVADELCDPKPLIGTAVPEELAIRENDLRFLVRLYDGYSTGLFLDHRDNRRRVRKLAVDRRVLNAFAYTCGFSVAAAAGGASQTFSVDISTGSLEWGKRNFEVNGIDPGGHGFIRSEIFDYLKRARRQGLHFDLVILDAPTFARSKRPARVFSIATDLPRLIDETLGVLAPGGFVLCSTNSRAQSAAWLREQVAAVAAEAGRRFQIVAAPPLPADFAADPNYAKTIMVRFP
ncbi:MAG TPA: class I SAM-dependent methyltransferase [Phycisphaerae bacterium]|nr:class I SAM-dependent methyltransferase [Phycisphaerae bacterium]